MIALVMTSLTIACLIFWNVRLSQRIADQEPKVRRLDEQCQYGRHTLKDVRRFLWSPDAERRRWGVDAFRRLMHEDWHETNICAREGVFVGGGCDLDDRGCMVHRLDWALVNVQ